MSRGRIRRPKGEEAVWILVLVLKHSVQRMLLMFIGMGRRRRLTDSLDFLLLPVSNEVAESDQISKGKTGRESYCIVEKLVLPSLTSLQCWERLLRNFNSTGVLSPISGGLILILYLVQVLIGPGSHFCGKGPARVQPHPFNCHFEIPVSPKPGPLSNLCNPTKRRPCTQVPKRP